MVEPVRIRREDFPKSESKSDGMITIVPKCDNDELCYIRDIEYADRDGIKLCIQLILPSCRSERPPLICYVQGSAFYTQDVIGPLMKLTLLARRGFAVASIQYRGSEIAPFPAQAEDARDAVMYMTDNADKYGIDAEKIFIMGDSSGGHTALLAALKYNAGVKGVIEYYAPIEFDRMNDELSTQNHLAADSPEGNLIGRKSILENPDLVEPTKVTNYITKEKNIPPIIIFHGTNDELVPFGQSCILYDKLKECNKEAYFYAMEGSHHGGREFWSEEVLDIVVGFIKKLSN